MMNEARIGVGLQGNALGLASLQAAMEFAHERIQGTSIESFKDANAPRVPIIMHPDVKRNLMICKAYSEGCRALLYYTAWLSDFAEFGDSPEQKKKYHNMLELLTPICKAYCSDMSFKVTELAMQVMGGYGYAKEYKVEQHMRDNKICSIYEGTNGIQAMDLLGRKVGLKGGTVFMGFIMQLNAFVDKNEKHEYFSKYVKMFQKAKDRLGEITMDFGMRGKKDLLYPVSHATPFLQMFGDVALGWLLLEQGVIAYEKLNAIYEAKGAADDEAKKAVILDDSEAKFYHQKIMTAQFFITQILPGFHAKYDAIKSEDRSVLDVVL